MEGWLRLACDCDLQEPCFGQASTMGSFFCELYTQLEHDLTFIVDTHTHTPFCIYCTFIETSSVSIDAPPLLGRPLHTYTSQFKFTVHSLKSVQFQLMLLKKKLSRIYTTWMSMLDLDSCRRFVLLARCWWQNGQLRKELHSTVPYMLSPTNLE